MLLGRLCQRVDLTHDGLGENARIACCQCLAQPVDGVASLANLRQRVVPVVPEPGLQNNAPATASATVPVRRTMRFVTRTRAFAQALHGAKRGFNTKSLRSLWIFRSKTYFEARRSHMFLVFSRKALQHAKLRRRTTPTRKAASTCSGHQILETRFR